MAKLSPKPKSAVLVHMVNTTLVAGSLLVGGCGDDTASTDAGNDAIIEQDVSAGVDAPGTDAPSDIDQGTSDADPFIDAGISVEDATGVDAPADAGPDAAES